jgi:hypothetical protein
MRNLHGVDVQMRRYVLLSDGEYKCQMHRHSIRFFRRQGLKQYMYYVHRDEDEKTLARHGLSKSIIVSSCKEVGRHLYEYLRNKKHMKQLKRKGYCRESDIRRIEDVNQENEI